MGVKTSEGLGQPPLTKSVSAALGICGNKQAIEESDHGGTPGHQAFPGPMAEPEPGNLGLTG